MHTYGTNSKDTKRNTVKIVSFLSILHSLSSPQRQLLLSDSYLSFKIICAYTASIFCQQMIAYYIYISTTLLFLFKNISWYLMSVQMELHQFFKKQFCCSLRL